MRGGECAADRKVEVAEFRAEQRAHSIRIPIAHFRIPPFAFRIPHSALAGCIPSSAFRTPNFECL
jgi:hypothetical protein